MLNVNVMQYFEQTAWTKWHGRANLPESANAALPLLLDTMAMNPMCSSGVVKTQLAAQPHTPPWAGLRIRTEKMRKLTG